MMDMYCAECQCQGKEIKTGGFHVCFENESVGYCESLLVPVADREKADEGYAAWKKIINDILQRDN